MKKIRTLFGMHFCVSEFLFLHLHLNVFVFVTLRWVIYFERDFVLFENINELQLVLFLIFMCIGKNLFQGFMVHEQKVLQVFSIRIILKYCLDKCQFLQTWLNVDCFCLSYLRLEMIDVDCGFVFALNHSR